MIKLHLIRFDQVRKKLNLLWFFSFFIFLFNWFHFIIAAQTALTEPKNLNYITNLIIFYILCQHEKLRHF